jgi:two-component system OmpR family response regulator
LLAASLTDAPNFRQIGCSARRNDHENKDMAGTATIVIVRKDLSIAGAEDDEGGGRQRGDTERHFFDLIREKRPDVVVFDLRNAGGEGAEGIAKVRERSSIPIVVICDADDPATRDYRVAGAIECLPAPVDIALFNQLVQQIISMKVGGTTNPVAASELVSVAGMMFRPYEKRLSASGSSINLTTAENRLLCHLVSRPRAVCRREEISEILYGRHRPTSDRAVDVIVTRLRKKLAELRGGAAQDLIKTEFREGYVFVGAVSPAAEAPAPESRHHDSGEGAPPAPNRA